MRLPSKRNTVCRVGDSVVKTVQSEVAAEREAAFLRALSQQGVAVPGGVRQSGRVIHMDYVDATPLPDLLTLPAFDAALRAAAGGLVAWLCDFYRAVGHESSGEIRGDVNGRNFLLRSGRVWGVDFEEHAHGPIERDIGRLLAFVETYTVPDPSRLTLLHNALLSCAVERLPLSVDLVQQEKALERAAMELRRNKRPV